MYKLIFLYKRAQHDRQTDRQIRLRKSFTSYPQLNV